MRVLVILAVLLGIALLLKPSKFKKFFFIYIVAIGSIGVLVYQGNKYVDKMSISRIAPSEISLTDFHVDTSLQIFLKGTVTNHSPDATLNELTLRFTLYGDTTGKDEPPLSIGSQDMKLFIRIAPGEHQEILEKLALEHINPSKKQRWDVRVISVRAALL